MKKRKNIKKKKKKKEDEKKEEEQKEEEKTKVCESGYFIPDNSEPLKENCIKCNIDNCVQCSGNKNSPICILCKEDYILYNSMDKCKKSCEIEPEEKCSSYDDTGKCISCINGYKLDDDKKCILNYSVKAIFNIDNINSYFPIINSLNFYDKIKEVQIDNVTMIDNKKTSYQFNKTGIHEVYILFDITKITYTDLMFSEVNKMTEIYFSSQFKDINLVSMRSMFYQCYSLTSVDLTNLNTKQVTNLGSMFIGCSSLTQININNFDTSKVSYMNNLFSGCSNLKAIDLSKFNTNSLKDIESMFNGCSSLT